MEPVRPVTKIALLTILGSGLCWAGEESLAEQPDVASDGSSWEWLLGGFQRVDWEGEALVGPDVTVLRTALAYEQRRDDLTIGTTLGYTDYEVDHVFGFLGANLKESNQDGSLDVAWQVKDDLEWSFSGRAYDGYPDYGAIWIEESYRRLFGGHPLYHAPDPGGWSVGSSLVWDVVPGATRLTFDLGYGEDDVVPGWSFNIANGMLEPSRERLDTISGGVSWEQAVNGWLKTEVAVRVQQITGREPRVQAQNNWAIALGTHWTVKLNTGATRERPSYEAYYGGVSIDYQFLPGWHAGLSGRFYEDTGEVETTGITPSAPGLHSYELAATLLYDAGDWAVRVTSGFFGTEFDPVDPANVVFPQLYRDRDWWVTRVALSFSF